MPTTETGPQPITNLEIKSWIENYGLTVNPEEIDMIFAMDDAYLSATAEEQKSQRERAQNKPPQPKRKF